MEASDTSDSSDQARPADPGPGKASRRADLRPLPGGELTVLVLGAEDRLPDELRRSVRAKIRQAPTADETEGLGVDVCVIAGASPVEQLRCLRAHPHLWRAPAIVVASSPSSAPGTVRVSPGPDLAARVATAMVQLAGATQDGIVRQAQRPQRRSAAR